MSYNRIHFLHFLFFLISNNQLNSLENDDIEQINGEWRLVGEVPIKDNGKCNIDRVDGNKLNQNEFVNEYAFTKPLIIENIDNTEFQRLTTRSQILKDWTGVPIVLNSANTHSYKRVESTIDKYIDTYLKPQSLDVLGNETLYLFGDIDPEVWKKLLDKYKQPKWKVPSHEVALSFGIAAAGTGVPFHFHGPGFAEVIHGSKRWFLTPHEQKPKFDPDNSTLEWYINKYPKLAENELPFECLMKTGELIYFPDKWYHATLNMETSVFISTFLSPIRGKLKKQEL